MQVNRCVSCMEEAEGYPCPHCGFDADAQPQPGYALPRNAILHGKYLVGKVLGQGGFGITYVGWDLALEIKVAIKEYYPTGQVVRQSSMSSKLQWSGDPRSEEARQAGMTSFLKEARKMARVDRIPQVVRVRDTFCENDTAYIIMDFVKGETLKVRLEREGPLSFGQAMEIFPPALAALEEVHKAGLVHRDLSPDNIMLEPDGGVRILDLGAAKDLAVNRGDSSMLVTKGGFSPLEQYGQRGGSGPWTDVYAMAATIYYTLTGILPPTAIDRLDGGELRWDLPALENLPAPAREALQKALAVYAKDRTQSMGEFLAGLERAPEPEPQPEPQSEPKPESQPEPEPTPEPEPEPKLKPEPKPEPQPEPQPVPKLKSASEEEPQRKKAPDILFAVVAAAGAVAINIGWFWYYVHTFTSPVSAWLGGILIAAALGFALKFSSHIPAHIIFCVSLLAGIIAGWIIYLIGHTARSLMEFALCGVGALVGALWVWALLKKLTNLPIRPIAVFSVITGFVLAVKNHIELYYPPAYYYPLEILSLLCLAATGLLTAGLCYVLKKYNRQPSSPPERKPMSRKNLLVIAAVCALVALVVLASMWVSRQAGPSATWKLDDAGVLTISGSGEMYDYDWPNDRPHWENRKGEITSVVVKPGVTKIGMWAFQECINLTSVTLPDGITKIGIGAFLECPSLTYITLPRSVTEIDNRAFENCSGLVSIALPEGMTRIGNRSFEGCSSLTRIVLPQSVTKIGWESFQNCTGLASITLPEGVTLVDDSTFEGCTRLTSITLPQSVTQIGWKAFSGCASLTDVYYGGTEEQWRNITIYEGNESLNANIHYNS